MSYSKETWFLEQDVATDALFIWQELVNLMAELCQTPAGFIVQVTDDGYQVVIANQSERNPYPAGGVIPTETNIFCRKVVQENRPLYVPNATQLTEWRTNPEVSDDKFNSYLGFPLYWPDGKVFGTICVMDFEITDYDDRYHRLLNHFKKMAERELQLLHEKLRVEQLSQLDEITGLLNRRGFQLKIKDRLKLATRHHEDVVVCYFDIDNLKNINDRLGHDVGDKIILTFAQAIRDSLRHTDIIARFGGDEFVAVMFVKHVEESSLVNKRLRKLLEQAELGVEIDFSVGAVVIEHNDIANAEIEQIIAQADKRMYTNKKHKRR